MATDSKLSTKHPFGHVPEYPLSFPKWNQYQKQAIHPFLPTESRISLASICFYCFLEWGCHSWQSSSTIPQMILKNGLPDIQVLWMGSTLNETGIQVHLCVQPLELPCFTKRIFFYLSYKPGSAVLFNCCFNRLRLALKDIL